jgi:hypothetical protein
VEPAEIIGLITAYAIGIALVAALVIAYPRLEVLDMTC